MPLDDPLTITVIVVGVIIACAIIIYAMMKKSKKEKIRTEAETFQPELKASPFKIDKSVAKQDASRAKDELRILDLEREILSDAIRHLYEAHAEGKITEDERERLAQTYKSRMMAVKDAITKDESLVALHELETMQEDLIRLFSERFDDLNSKIGELRSKVEIEPVKEVSIPIAEEQDEKTEERAGTEEKAKRKRKPPQEKQTPKTEAEKRIEEIRSEVEKVLDRLGQMEVEG